MSNYPPGFGIQEQADYFGRPHDSYAMRERKLAEAEALAERAKYADAYDKWTDPEVIEWRMNYARTLRALLRAKHAAR